MSGRDRDKFRKYLSGSQKEKKKQKREQFIASQKGAFEKYLHSQPGPSNQAPILKDDVTAILPLSEQPDLHCHEDDDLSILSSQVDLDLADPGKWPNIITSSVVEEIVRSGPMREVNYAYPINENKRRFSSDFYTKTLPNGEKSERKWLVYSKTKDKVYCFCCKLFAMASDHDHSPGKIADNGFCDWKHLGTRLQGHEQSTKHADCIKKWVECEQRLSKQCSINQAQLTLIEKERKRWREVLRRIILAIKYLAQHNIALRGTNDVLYKENNGNFLGLIQMIAEFDPIMEEHLRRIRSKEIHDHYLGPRVQNELINLMALEVKRAIVAAAKKSKYYAVMLDCTPDAGHKEQMTLIIRYVHFSKDNVTVEEHFMDFLNVLSSKGENLFDCLISKLNDLRLDLTDCRGQSYDNGANMKGVHSGVQARLLNMNPRAFFMPCASHSLNLLICDAAKSTPKAVTFFGIVGRLFALFSSSTQRWDILLKHVPSLTLKKLSDTRWESRVESVKAIKYQSKEILNALLEVHSSTDEPKSKCEAQSLAVHELRNYEFILSVAIWYDILFACNSVSKTLQAEDMDLQVASQSLSGLINFLKKFREEGFVSSRITANEMAETLEVDAKFEEKRSRKKRKLFKYEGDDDVCTDDQLSAENMYKIDYFYPIIDIMIAKVNERFSQFETYSRMFGFLYTPKKMNDLNDSELKEKCLQLEQDLTAYAGPVTVSHEDEYVSKDISGSELLTEIKVFREIVPDDIDSPVKVLKYLHDIKNPFPNLQIVYRILLTIPITVASAERSFSRLKLIKTYLRTTVSQERLSSLATLSIEYNTVENINFDTLIDEFAKQKSRKVNFIL